VRGSQAAGKKRYAAPRKRGHSKNGRGDAPQIVIGVAVTREGSPVRFKPQEAARQKANRDELLADVEAELESLHHVAEGHSKRECALRSSSLGDACLDHGDGRQRKGALERHLDHACSGELPDMCE